MKLAFGAHADFHVAGNRGLQVSFHLNRPLSSIAERALARAPRACRDSYRKDWACTGTTPTNLVL